MNVYLPKPEEIPSGICECGCGKPTPLVTATSRKRRRFRGHPAPYLHGHGPRKQREQHHLWKGGRITTSAGYIKAYAPQHPDADNWGYVWEHRLVAEEKLGRPLAPDEFVHHVNHDKADNVEENLEVLSKKAHNAHHAADRKYDSEKMRAAGRKGAAARWGYLRANETANVIDPVPVTSMEYRT